MPKSPRSIRDPERSRVSVHVPPAISVLLLIRSNVLRVLIFLMLPKCFGLNDTKKAGE